jgi:hypothetical protein
MLVREWGEAMTRDARKRWLTRIALVALAGLIGVTVWRWRPQPRPGDAIGPAVLHTTGPLGPTDPDASLVVTEYLHDQPEHRTRVVRYDFKNGRPQPPEALWEGSSRRFGSLGLQPIIENRYLVSGGGSVIDLREKTLIHEGAGRLLEVRGDRVVSGFYNDSGILERLAAFNLRTRAIEQLTDGEVETITRHSKLPGERSPDGLKSVTAGNNSLTLYRVGHPPKELGRFELGDQYPVSPGVWLDNDRFLTQDGNGNLLAVGLAGARVPVMRIPIEGKPNSSPYFRRDADGRIIYACGREQFLINPEAKAWERCEWESRGHGFGGE